jgi:hypothetical protein
MVTDIGPEVPAFVVGDGARIQQVLRVLLAFLFQHLQHSGDVKLSLTCLKSERGTPAAAAAPPAAAPAAAAVAAAARKRSARSYSVPTAPPGGSAESAGASEQDVAGPAVPAAASPWSRDSHRSSLSTESSADTVLQISVSGSVASDLWRYDERTSGSSGACFSTSLSVCTYASVVADAACAVIYVAERLCAVMNGRFAVTHGSSRVTFSMQLPVLTTPPPRTIDSSVGLRVLYADVRAICCGRWCRADRDRVRRTSRAISMCSVRSCMARRTSW